MQDLIEKKIIDELSKYCKSRWHTDLDGIILLGVVKWYRTCKKQLIQGKCICLFSKTVAGYDNVKEVGLFEAMACKQVIITSYMPELEKIF